MIEFFIYGTIFGLILFGIISMISTIKSEYSLYKKPLYNFLSSPISSYEFISRSNHLVSLTYDKYILYLDLNKKQLMIFEGENLVIIETKLNHKEIEHLYTKLNKGFNKEIHEDITEINGLTLSNNIIPEVDGEPIVETYHTDPTLDEILDKISLNGKDSLTETELRLLKKYGNQ